jgi:hypothetical protein
LSIPLVLNFFANPEHIHALSVLDLQSIIDSVIFEPGLWASSHPKTAPTVVPAPDRSFLATPLGLLFNELCLSPEANISPLTRMLENALDLDPGCYTEEAGFMILYVIRLLVRIEGFLDFFLNYNTWVANSNSEATSKSHWEGFVRGLESTTEHIQLITRHRGELKEMLLEQVYPMLERWVAHAVKLDDMATACMLHAHLAYLFLHLSYEELSPKIAVTLLSSQIFLNSHYHFHSQLKGSAKKEKRISEKRLSLGLGIPDTEIFDLFQKHRGNILRYLMEDQTRRNDIMETVVQVVTMSTKDNRVSSNYMAGATGLTRHWRNMDGLHNVGRFVPDLSPRTAEEQAKAERERFQSRGQTPTEVMINIQLGTLTLNNAVMERLDDRIYGMADFREVFGDLSHMGCAAVKITTKRQWVHVMGTRFDLQLWRPDDRMHNAPGFTRKYVPSEILASAEEQWIASIFEPVRNKYKMFASGDLFLPSASYSKTDLMAKLVGFEVDTTVVAQKIEEAPKQLLDHCFECEFKFTLTERRHHCKRCGHTICGNCSFVGKVHQYSQETRLCPKCKVAEAQRKYMREIIIWRKYRTVHYYRVVEHGRQLYRTLIFSSDWRYSLHDMPWIHSLTKPTEVLDRYCAAEGSPPDSFAFQIPTKPKHSLIVLRNLGNSSTDQQTYIPNRFLRGLLPQPLINEYMFWQVCIFTE